MDISFEMEIIKTVFCEEAAIIRGALIAPNVLYHPTLSQDGSMWCALYGENLQEGVAGFGETPEKAMAAFDHAWKNAPTPQAALDNGQFGVGA